MEIQVDVREVIEQLRLVETSYGIETVNEDCGLNVGQLRPCTDLGTQETRVS